MKNTRDGEAKSNNVETTLREFEAAHRIYMQTSRFSAKAEKVKAEMLAAKAKHAEAVKAAHPDWIVL